MVYRVVYLLPGGGRIRRRRYDGPDGFDRARRAIRKQGGRLLAVAVPRRGLRDVLAEARAIAYATWP